MGLIAGGINTYLSVFVVRLGASSFVVSLLTSLPAIIMTMLSIPAGLLVERQRKLVRLTSWGRLVARTFTLLVALLPFFVSRGLAEAAVVINALQAVPIAFINLSWTAVIAEIIPAKRRARINGNRWALVSLVTAVVVAVYGAMLERIPFPTGYQIVFGISFLGGLLSAYLFSLIRMPSEPLARAASAQAIALSQRLRGYLKSIAETPVFLRYLLTSFVLRFGLHLPAALYSIYWVRNLNASDAWIGWRATAGSLALIVGYLLWGRLASRKGHHLVLLVCTIAVGSYPVLTALTPSQVWLPLVAVVWGLFITGIDVSIFDTLLSVCPEDKRPSFVAVNTLFAHLAIFLAPMAGSLLSEWLDIRVVLFIAGGIHLVAALLFRLLRVAAEEVV
jgi:MFS family permease